VTEKILVKRISRKIIDEAKTPTANEYASFLGMVWMLGMGSQAYAWSPAWASFAIHAFPGDWVICRMHRYALSMALNGSTICRQIWL
jgi:hypothetical protein